jgi:hypothetical protein
VLGSAWPFERPILVATSDPAEALVLRAAMQALCRQPEAFAALVTGTRVGRASGLTLCGLARDAGCALPALLLTGEDTTVIAPRAARLHVTVLWQPVSSGRLASALHDLLPRRRCVAC